MKSKYKYFVSAALSGLFGLLVAFSASAQRGGRGGGGGSHGGGSHGGGGFHSGGGFSGGRSSGGFSGSHSGGRIQSPGSGGSYNRGGGFSGSRPSAGYATPRGSYSSPRVNASPSYRGNTRADIGSRGSVGGSRYGVSPRVYAYGGGNRTGYSRGYSNGGARVGFGYRGYSGSYNHGRYYSYNRFGGRYAYYNRYYAPRLGFRLSVLPYGYYPFYWGDYQYFYSDGYYYQYNNNDYTVVEPPLGAILDQLPAGAKSLMIDGEQYYELNGVYYQAITKDDGSTGYQIAGKDGELSTGAGTPQDDGTYNQQGGNADQAPIRIGDTFDSLPPNCSSVKIDGQKYYVSPDGVYYQEDRDGNRKIYRVAGTPDDQPGN
jgi:hypothetical protein